MDSFQYHCSGLVCEYIIKYTNCAENTYEWKSNCKCYLRNLILVCCGRQMIGKYNTRCNNTKGKEIPKVVINEQE